MIRAKLMTPHATGGRNTSHLAKFTILLMSRTQCYIWHKAETRFGRFRQKLDTQLFRVRHHLILRKTIALLGCATHCFHCL